MEIPGKYQNNSFGAVTVKLRKATYLLDINSAGNGIVYEKALYCFARFSYIAGQTGKRPET